MANISFSAANEATVQGSGLLFALTFVDAVGQPRQIFAVGTKVP
jgi:hypothetical protein